MNTTDVHAVAKLQRCICIMLNKRICRNQSKYQTCMPASLKTKMQLNKTMLNDFVSSFSLNCLQVYFKAIAKHMQVYKICFFPHKLHLSPNN